MVDFSEISLLNFCIVKLKSSKMYASDNILKTDGDDKDERSYVVRKIGGRQSQVRRLSTSLRHSGRQARHLSRQGEPGGDSVCIELWESNRCRDRSHREEAAQLFPSRHYSLFLCNNRLQPALSLVPELGDFAGLQTESSDLWRGHQPGRACAAGFGCRLSFHRLHLHGTDHLCRICARHNEAGP